MKSITYAQFLALVCRAHGPFSYIFAGQRFICDPVVYLALNERLEERRAA